MKTYKIKTFQDITDCVTTANLDNFLVDLKAILLHTNLIKAASFGAVKEFEDFLWTDDGLNDFVFKVSEIGGDGELVFKATDRRRDPHQDFSVTDFSFTKTKLTDILEQAFMAGQSEAHSNNSGSDSPDFEEWLGNHPVFAPKDNEDLPFSCDTTSDVPSIDTDDEWEGY